MVITMHGEPFWQLLEKTQPANRAQKIRKPGAKNRKRAQSQNVLEWVL